MTPNHLRQRGSVRSFRPDPVPADILDDILASAIQASNTGNMQIYSIIVTTREDLRAELCQRAHFSQPMVKSAPVHLTFCADLNRFNLWCRQRGAEPGYDNFLSFFTASVDAIIAAQTAIIAAESHGLGICYLGTVNYNAATVGEILRLPASVVPVASIVIGYPVQQPPLTHRLPMEAVVHRETYSDFSPAQIDALYAEREASDETAQLIATNQTPSLAHIFTDKRYTRANNEAFSTALLSYIDKQGFGPK